MKNNFFYAERNDGQTNYNKINYAVGPVSIKVLGLEGLIICEIKEKWKYLFPDFKETITEALDLKLNNIIEETDTTIKIRFDFEIIKKYLEYEFTFN